MQCHLQNMFRILVGKCVRKQKFRKPRNRLELNIEFCFHKIIYENLELVPVVGVINYNFTLLCSFITGFRCMMLHLFNNHHICVPVLVLEVQRPERQSMSTVETQSITYSRGTGNGERTVTISVASTTHQTAVFSEDGLQGTVLNKIISLSLSTRIYAWAT
jgi:hypothetical protein